MKKVILSMFVVGLALTTSCTPSDDDTTKTDDVVVIDAQQKDQQESFGALKTIQGSLKSKDKTGAQLKGIYDSKLKGHLAVDVYHVDTKEDIRNEFSQWLVSWGEAVDADTDATNGVPGKIGNRIVNGKGIEQEQMFKKGMIGAYQLSNALTEAQKAMDANADRESILVNVTAYLLGSYESLDQEKVSTEVHGEQAMAYPIYEGNEFAKYLNAVALNPKFSTVADDLYGALKEARTHIKSEDGTFQNKILEAVGIAQKVVAVRGVHYLLAGSAVIEDDSKFEKAIHGLSEGFGFYYSLQFTYNPMTHQSYYTKTDVDAFLSEINLWDTTASKETCQELAEEIAQKFGFNATDA